MAEKSSSSKRPLQAEEQPTAEQAKSVPKPGKIGKEIDEIFGGKKRNKLDPEKIEKKPGRHTKQSAEEDSMKETKKKKKRRKGEKLSRFNDPPTQPRKRTVEGLAIYTEEELGVNKANAGSTSLCPFDCDCCF